MIPGLIGYCIILAGLTELTGFSRRFVRTRPVVMAALVYSAIIYVLDLVGASLVATQPRTLALGLVSAAFAIYISHSIIAGVKDIETASGLNLETAPLYTAWGLWAAFSLAAYVTVLFPGSFIMFVIVSFIFAVLLL